MTLLNWCDSNRQERAVRRDRDCSQWGRTVRRWQNIPRATAGAAPLCFSHSLIFSQGFTRGAIQPRWSGDRIILCGALMSHSDTAPSLAAICYLIFLQTDSKPLPVCETPLADLLSLSCRVWPWPRCHSDFSSCSSASPSIKGFVWPPFP